MAGRQSRPVFDDDLLVDVDRVVIVAFGELECGGRQLVGGAVVEGFETADLGCLVAETVRRVQHQTIPQRALSS